jgi:cholestenol delta-isomerase
VKHHGAVQEMTITDSELGGSIHCFFEGYFVYNRDRMPSMMDIFGQLWKEYGLSDSRYIFCDPLLLCMEILSVVSLHSLTLLPEIIFICKSIDPCNADIARVRLVYAGPAQLPHSLADHQ